LAIIVSSFVILYIDDYIFGDMSMFLLVILIIKFVVCIMVLIINPNVVSILLGSDFWGLVSSCVLSVATNTLG
jgi:NADH-ubiquinone oxidoreductase chain 5